jgi:hypothetical protein
MVQYSPGGYVDYIWVSAAMSGFNLLLLFLFYPESNFQRPDLHDAPLVAESKPGALEIESANEASPGPRDSGDQAEYVVDKRLASVWTTFVTVDHSVNFLKVFLRPFVLLLCPDVLFATLLYGITLASQIILM